MTSWKNTDRSVISSRSSATVRILGIDPGTRIVGYGVVDHRKVAGPSSFAYIECGVIEAPSTVEIPERLTVVAAGLVELLAEFEPDVLAIEKAYYGRNAASALKLGQARGAVMAVAGQRGVPVHEYAPARVKQVVVGHGRATKEQIQRRVRMLFKLRQMPSTDAADALAIAICHAQCAPPRYLAGVRS